MRLVIQNAVRLFSSFGLVCVLLLLLGLLTWLGTLAQVDLGLYEVQKKYFESCVLLHEWGPISIPLPGAKLVLIVLFANLLVGGVGRLRWRAASLGVGIAHLGIALLLVSGFVKSAFCEEGHVTLFEGERASHFQSYYRWEIAILEDLGGGRVREHLAPQELFADAVGSEPVTLTSNELPFDLEVQHVMRNCRPLPKGPMFEVDVPVVDGFFLRSEAPLAEAEANIAGAYVEVLEKRGGARHAGILWGAETSPLELTLAEGRWGIALRKERYPMPFTLALESFTKEDHPGTAMPKAFSSDVEVLDGTHARAVEISMNEPLREQGLVLYQASFGPANALPGEPLFSTFAVVENPADRIPLYGCLVVAAGLALHFSRKLVRYVRSEARGR